jgi:hypothetical protein
MGPLFLISLLIHVSVRQLFACLICSTRNLRCPINATIFYNIFRNGTSFYNNLFSVNLQKMLQNFRQTLVGKNMYIRKQFWAAKLKKGHHLQQKEPMHPTVMACATNITKTHFQHWRILFIACANY